MGLSKKQRLEKQRKQRLRRLAKAKVVFYNPQTVEKPWKVPDVGQHRLVSAVSGAATATQRGCLYVAWLALLPFMLAGRATSAALEAVAAPFDVCGTALAGAAFWLFVEVRPPAPFPPFLRAAADVAWQAWSEGKTAEPEWMKRMEKLEKEMARLKQEMKATKAAAARAPAQPLPKAKSAKGVTAALPPPPPPMAMAPPPPPPMGLPPPPTPGKLVFKKPRTKAKAEAASSGISLSALLSAKGGLKSGNRPLQGLPPKARNGMLPISLKDISGVQLKKTVRKSDENAPKNTLPSKSVAVQLRKTQIQRSPGGTPMRPAGIRESSDNQTNIISSALRTKFKSIRVKSPRSSSPAAGSDAEESYLSPYKPRSRLPVR